MLSELSQATRLGRFDHEKAKEGKDKGPSMRGRRVFGRVLASLGQRLVQLMSLFAHVYEILCAEKGGNRTRKRVNFRQLNARISASKMLPRRRNPIIYADFRVSFFGSRLHLISSY
jgi:hypothetical protein